MILVEMFTIITTVRNAFTNKLFTGKQVNRCQVVFSLLFPSSLPKALISSFQVLLLSV